MDLPPQLWQPVLRRLDTHGAVRLCVVAPMLASLLGTWPGPFVWGMLRVADEATLKDACRWLLAVRHPVEDDMLWADVCDAVRAAARAGDLALYIGLAAMEERLRPARPPKCYDSGVLRLPLALTGVQVMEHALVGGCLSLCRRVAATLAPKYHHHMLATAARSGNLAVCQWLVDHFGVTAEDAGRGDHVALKTAIAYGHLPVVHWLADRFGVTPQDAQRPKKHQRCLQEAVSRGHVHTCRWMMDGHPMGQHHDDMLRDAACRGSAATCRWLVERLGPGLEYAFQLDVVMGAVRNSHFALALWLVGEFSPQVGNIILPIALDAVAREGRLEACQWVVAHFGDRFLGWCEVATSQALVGAASGGNLAVCRWLADQFRDWFPFWRTFHGADSTNRVLIQAMQAAARKGHLAVCVWLADRFHFTSEMAAADNDRALSYALDSGHLGVSQWLVARFALTPKWPFGRLAPYRNAHMCRWLVVAARPSVPDARAAFLKAVAAGNVAACQLLAACSHFASTSDADGVCVAAWHALFYVCHRWSHSGVCRWLVNHFHWTAAHRHLLPKDTFVRVALEADTQTCRWLAHHFQLTRHMAWHGKVVALRRAAEIGDVEKCQWLVADCGLTAGDVRFNNTAPFRYAAKGGHLPMCRWLVDHFGLTVDDVRAKRDAAYMHANPNRDLRRWMAVRFHLTPDKIAHKTI